MRAKALLWTTGLVIGGYMVVAGYALTRQGIEPLLLCADKGGLAIPMPQHICRQYLFAFRGTPDDIETLEQGIGASFIVQGESSKEDRSEVLAFLVERGLDPNHIDMHGLTPLHAAVLANDVEEARILLAHGARVDIQDRAHGLTALEFSRQLLEQNHADIESREPLVTVLRDQGISP
ncbi:MAG: ankyrin repeat domain-containing protein [Lysobacter sp.]